MQLLALLWLFRMLLIGSGRNGICFKKKSKQKQNVSNRTAPPVHPLRRRVIPRRRSLFSNALIGCGLRWLN